MKKSALRTIRESFKACDEAVVNFLKLLITIAGATIALRLKNDVGDFVAKAGLGMLLLSILFGVLCIHYLLTQKKIDNPQSLDQETILAEKEEWGKSALQVYKCTSISFLAGLLLLIVWG